MSLMEKRSARKVEPEEAIDAMSKRSRAESDQDDHLVYPKLTTDGVTKLRIDESALEARRKARVRQ